MMDRVMASCRREVRGGFATVAGWDLVKSLCRFCVLLLQRRDEEKQQSVNGVCVKRAAC